MWTYAIDHMCHLLYSKLYTLYTIRNVNCFSIFQRNTKIDSYREGTVKNQGFISNMGMVFDTDYYSECPFVIQDF